MSKIFDNVFFAGFDCAMGGGNYTDNPYDAKEYRQAWEDGFNNGVKQMFYMMEYENNGN